MRVKAFLGLNVLLVTFLPPRTEARQRCQLASFRTYNSLADACVIKFAHSDVLPPWLDKLDIEGSLTRASDEQLEDLAKNVCSCAFFRVHRSCSNSLYETVLALSWRCFPNARSHVMQRLADAVERRRISLNVGTEHEVTEDRITEHEQNTVDTDGQSRTQKHKSISSRSQKQQTAAKSRPADEQLQELTGEDTHTSIEDGLSKDTKGEESPTTKVEISQAIDEEMAFATERTPKASSKVGMNEKSTISGKFAEHLVAGTPRSITMTTKDAASITYTFDSTKQEIYRTAGVENEDVTDENATMDVDGQAPHAPTKYDDVVNVNLNQETRLRQNDSSTEDLHPDEVVMVEDIVEDKWKKLAS